MIHIKLANKKNVSIMLTSLAVSACMIITSIACGNMAYGAEAPAGDENFNYNGYSATQLKKISECISGVVPESECPSYEASSKDYYTDTGGTVNHANMPAGVISTKSGWLKWADAAMKANSYDGVYGTLRIASEWATGSTSSSTDVRFRLIGINQDDMADGTGKAGLTFQAIGQYNIESAMNTTESNAGGWRDSMMRKNLNDESTGTIWNAIQSTDFKNNVTPVLKTTNNNANDGKGNSDNTSTTADKLYILSPSEMGMPIIKNYKVIYYWYYHQDESDANVHYYDSGSYKNTIKSSNDGNYNSVWADGYNYKIWEAGYNYIYSGNAYQWWMLPAGSRKMSNGSQSYHNTNSYSYCAIANIVNTKNPSINTHCSTDSYWLRSFGDVPSYPSIFSDGYLGTAYPSTVHSVILAFAF